MPSALSAIKSIEDAAALNSALASLMFRFASCILLFRSRISAEKVVVILLLFGIASPSLIVG